MKKWVIHRDGQSFGPFVSAEIRDGLRTGAIDPFDLVATLSNPSDVKELIEINEIFESKENLGSMFSVGKPIGAVASKANQVQAKNKHIPVPSQNNKKTQIVKKEVKNIKTPAKASIPQPPVRDQVQRKKVSNVKRQVNGFSYNPQVDGPNGVERVSSGYLGGAARISPSQNKRPLKRVKLLEERKRISYKTKKYLILRRGAILSSVSLSQLYQLYKKGMIPRDAQIQKISGGPSVSIGKFVKNSGHVIARKPLKQSKSNILMLWLLVTSMMIVIGLLVYIAFFNTPKTNDMGSYSQNNIDSLDMENLRKSIASRDAALLNASTPAPANSDSVEIIEPEVIKVVSKPEVVAKKIIAKPKPKKVVLKTIIAKPKPKPKKVVVKTIVTKPIVKIPAYVAPKVIQKKYVAPKPVKKISTPKPIAKPIKKKPTVKNSPKKPSPKNNLSDISALGSKQGQTISLNKLKYSKGGLSNCSPPKCSLTMFGADGKSVQVSFFKMAPVYKKLLNSSSPVGAKVKVLSSQSLLLLDIN